MQNAAQSLTFWKKIWGESGHLVLSMFLCLILPHPPPPRPLSAPKIYMAKPLTIFACFCKTDLILCSHNIPAMNHKGCGVRCVVSCGLPEERDEGWASGRHALIRPRCVVELVNYLATHALLLQDHQQLHHHSYHYQQQLGRNIGISTFWTMLNLWE